MPNPHDHDEPSRESDHIESLLREFGYSDDLTIEDVDFGEEWDA